MQVDSYDSPDAEALLRLGKQRRTRPLDRRRELTTHAAAAATFLVAAALLAALAPGRHALHPLSAGLAVLTYIVVERVRFPVADSWTYPTMLAFVPMLFLVPTPLVPLTAMLAILLGGLPGYLRGRTTPTRLPADIADAWYTVGPTLVLVLAGAQHFAWSNWPIYVAAVAAQILVDATVTLTRCSIGEGINPRVQLPLLSWIYISDTTLWPLGLLIASAAVARPGLVLLAISPTALLYLFARERRERLDQTLVLSSAYRGTALLLGEVIEADDAYTGIHSREVVDLALGVGDAMGLDSTSRRNLEFTALLHDVGKIHVPKEVLHKPGRLDDDEWKILHRHTIEGERMLRQVGGSLANVGHLVRSSHERYDGNGYPDRLAGDEIPIESRIVSVCDAFNAMTTDRPYRAAMSVADAFEELHREAGRQFDPDVVKAFDSVVSPPAESRVDPRMPRWVKVPDGQIERALKVLTADRERSEHLELASGR